MSSFTVEEAAIELPAGYVGFCICGNYLTYPDEYIDGVQCHACYIFDRDPTVHICDHCSFVDEAFFVFIDEDGDEEVVCLECIRSEEQYEFTNKMVKQC
jgi:hypothetical protein